MSTAVEYFDKTAKENEKKESKATKTEGNNLELGEAAGTGIELAGKGVEAPKKRKIKIPKEKETKKED